MWFVELEESVYIGHGNELRLRLAHAKKFKTEAAAEATLAKFRSSLQGPFTFPNAKVCPVQEGWVPFEAD
jgi:hypothetical protein